MLLNKCPGAAGISGAPTIKEKKCPNCGTTIEVFSVDTKVSCENCGFTVYNDMLSCVKWCKFAKECVGEKMYEKLMEHYNTDPKASE